jgi:MYXO-CTERM domain-containing protein
MMVTSIDPAETITQDDVFDLLDEYSFWAINAAVLNLIVAKKGEVEGSMTAEEIDLNWVAGLRYVGSVFHLVEDSSVTCSDEAQALVPVCVPGDGHTIVQPVDGRLQVVALSDNVYYERNVEGGEKPHGALDGLHQAALVEQVYGAFDPALATSRILVLVAAGVDRAVHEDLAAIPLFVNGEPNAEFDAAAFSISSAIANEIFDEVIDPRFADAGDRITLPPLSRSDDDKSDDPAEEGDDAESSGCRVVDETPAGTPWLLAVVALAARRRRDTTP